MASCGGSAPTTGTEEKTTQVEHRKHRGDQFHFIESSKPSALIYSQHLLDFSALTELSSSFITLLDLNWFHLPDGSESSEATSARAASVWSACAGSGSKGGAYTSGIGWEDVSSLEASEDQRGNRWTWVETFDWLEQRVICHTCVCGGLAGGYFCSHCWRSLFWFDCADRLIWDRSRLRCCCLGLWDGRAVAWLGFGGMDLWGLLWSYRLYDWHVFCLTTRFG